MCRKQWKMKLQISSSFQMVSPTAGSQPLLVIKKRKRQNWYFFIALIKPLKATTAQKKGREEERKTTTKQSSYFRNKSANLIKFTMTNSHEITVSQTCGPSSVLLKECVWCRKELFTFGRKEGPQVEISEDQEEGKKAPFIEGEPHSRTL